MKKKYIWCIEIIIWFFIIAVSLYFFIYNTAIKENVKNSYYIFVDDAEGLVKGSPVKLMGVDIGYVKDVKIFDNKVFVSFLITKDNTKLPEQVFSTIEFYGLGGSTSLELHPTNHAETNSDELIIPSISYRVQDYWDGQELVSRTLIDTYTGLGKSIQDLDLVNNKDLLKQSGLVKDITTSTSEINTAQAVMIYKLTENLLKREEKKGNKIEASQNE